MATKTTGIEWKCFYNDDVAWPKDAYHEDEEMTVDGKIWADMDMMEIPDIAIVTVAGGVVYLKKDNTTGPTLEAHFKRWRKNQNTVFFSCEAPRDCAESVREAILASGGKVYGL